MKVYYAHTNGAENFFSTREKAVNYCLQWYRDFLKTYPNFPPYEKVKSLLEKKGNYNDFVFVGWKLLDPEY